MMVQLGFFGPWCLRINGDQQYLCYTCPTESTMKINVTNAVDLWSVEVAQEALVQKTGSVSTEDYGIKFRKAFDDGNASLELTNGLASLHIKTDCWTVSFDLFKQPVSEGKTQIQALMFNLVERASSLEKRLQAAESAAAAAASSCSHEKSLSKTQRLLMPGLDSRRGGRGGPPTAAVKRIPGESLINPGFKRKKAATGVDFEES